MNNCKEAETADTSCKVCKDDYFLLEYDSANNLSRCCASGEYVNDGSANAPDKGKCETNTITNCKFEKYNSNGNSCTECKSGYKIISNPNN